MDYEVKRNDYKPNKVKILFVGESRPQQGTFFYFGNSNLFSYTKQAFEQAAKKKYMTDAAFLDEFKNLGCWLYDVCDCPVNHCTKTERKKAINDGIDALRNTIQKLNPEFIIVVKKGYFGKRVMQEICNVGYNDSHSFNLPFPSFGHQREYIDQLADVLKKIL